MKVVLGILWMYLTMLFGYPVAGLLAWAGYRVYQLMMWYDGTHQVVGSKEGQFMVFSYATAMLLCWFVAACAAHETYSCWEIFSSGRKGNKNQSTHHPNRVRH